MIPKKYRGVPWCEYVIPVGDSGQFSHDKNLKVNDIVQVVMNVDLIDNKTKDAIWGKFEITKVIHENFYEGKRTE